MRREIKHLKRYKSYPKNVPKKLLKMFFDLDCKVSKLAQKINVNSGTVSNLLNNGTEPKNERDRKALYLPLRPVCPCCNRKIINRTKQNSPKSQQPEYLKKWKHLSKDERQKVIQEYLKWKKII